jgi:hypothetical protein
MVHTKEPVQSLLRMHVPPTSIFFAELQPAGSHAETTIKPRTRDVDISILQVCFQRPEKPTGRGYHSGPVMVRPRARVATHFARSGMRAGKASWITLRPGFAGRVRHGCSSNESACQRFLEQPVERDPEVLF